MSRPYFTEDQKMYNSPYPRWTWDEITLIQKILKEKGYLVDIVTRIACDRKAHDSWRVEREDIPQLIEELFRQRITVEVQAEGGYKASLNFCYDYSAETIIEAVSKFRKNKLNGGKL